jgi:hypothetical protein
MQAFFIGVYAFIFGSVRFPWEISVSGWRARVSSLFLMAPLPILILLGWVISQGVDQQNALSFFGIANNISWHPWRSSVLLSY